MGFKIEKRDEAADAKKTGPWAWAGLALVALWGIQQGLFPQYSSCTDCSGLVPTCGAPGCAGSQVQCKGTCLSLDSPGWEHMSVAGHPDSDIWMSFKNDDGSTQAWNQGHVGRSFEKIDEVWRETGNCMPCGAVTLTRRWLWPL